MGSLGLGRGFQRGSCGGLEGGRDMVRPSGVEVMVVVVRRVVMRDWVASRAVDWRRVLSCGRGRLRSSGVGGRGFGSVVER